MIDGHWLKPVQALNPLVQGAKNHVHHTLRDDDNLYNLLAFHIFGSALIGTYSCFDGSVVGISSKLHLETGLAVEGYTQLHLALYQILLKGHIL